MILIKILNLLERRQLLHSLFYQLTLRNLLSRLTGTLVMATAATFGCVDPEDFASEIPLL